ncbi:MAG TPA: ISAs1 family transposase [Ktedonobacteraceae bacterium]
MTTLTQRLSLPNQALLFDLERLYRCLHTVPDRRKRRGRRYPLAALLMIGVLAKLAGQDSSRALAHWAKLRQKDLSQLFQLQRESMPHYSTWSRVLGRAVSPEEVEQAISQFFAGEKPSKSPKRGSIQVCLDGKTLRGTIPAGQSQGVHLMAAYLPEQGVVLMQMEVGEKTNEITVAPKIVRTLDLRGVVVTGDAMQAQRKLSAQIVEAQGDYVWTAKDNQPEVRAEIALLFAPQQSRPGWSAPPTDFRQATTFNKGHGRLEKRTITVSSLLSGYSTFPYVAQVYQVESWAQLTGGRSQHEIRSGLTSLPAAVASPDRLLELVRGQWQIENGLHYRRDMTLREDHSQLRMGHAPHVLALLNNIVVGLVARQGKTNLAEARREFAYHLERALAA